MNSVRAGTNKKKLGDKKEMDGRKSARERDEGNVKSMEQRIMMIIEAHFPFSRSLTRKAGRLPNIETAGA